MGEQVQVTAWLNKYKRNKFISIHRTLKNKYNIAMVTLFSNIEDSANEYKEQLEVKFGAMFSYEVVDPSHIYENIELEAYDFYEAEKLMEYNFHFSLLATMYQIFEQQLRSFIYSEINHHTNPVRIEKEFSEFGTNMGNIKEYYKFLNYDLSETTQWETIETLGDLVNAYKHGNGRSANRLYRKSQELFLKAYYGGNRRMDQELTTNSEIVFDIEKINFDSYANAIIEFWTEFPEQITGIHILD